MYNTSNKSTKSTKSTKKRVSFYMEEPQKSNISKKTTTNANANIISQLKASGTFKMPTEKRIDTSDNNSYTLNSFIQEYGLELGTQKWDNSKLDDPNKPKIEFINDMIDPTFEKKEWVVPPPKPARNISKTKQNKMMMRKKSMVPIVTPIRNPSYTEVEDMLFTEKEHIQQYFEDWDDEDYQELDAIHYKLIREYSRINEYLHHLDIELFADIEFENDNWFTPVGKSSNDIKYLIGGNWQEILDLFEQILPTYNSESKVYAYPGYRINNNGDFTYYV